METFYWSYLRKSVPMTLIVRVPYSSFVPGQVIPFIITIENKSNVVIESVTVKLQKVILLLVLYFNDFVLLRNYFSGF